MIPLACIACEETDFDSTSANTDRILFCKECSAPFCRICREAAHQDVDRNWHKNMVELSDVTNQEINSLVYSIFKLGTANIASSSSQEQILFDNSNINLSATNLSLDYVPLVDPAPMSPVSIPSNKYLLGSPPPHPPPQQQQQQQQQINQIPQTLQQLDYRLPSRLSQEQLNRAALRNRGMNPDNLSASSSSSNTSSTALAPAMPLPPSPNKSSVDIGSSQVTKPPPPPPSTENVVKDQSAETQVPKKQGGVMALAKAFDAKAHDVVAPANPTVQHYMGTKANGPSSLSVSSSSVLSVSSSSVPVATKPNIVEMPPPSMGGRQPPVNVSTSNYSFAQNPEGPSDVSSKATAETKADIEATKGEPVIVLIHGGKSSPVFCHQCPANIGRDPRYAVIATDHSVLTVSAIHAQLRFENGKFFVASLSETNKTNVKFPDKNAPIVLGHQDMSPALCAGTEIILGTYSMLVQSIGGQVSNKTETVTAATVAAASTSYVPNNNNNNAAPSTTPTSIATSSISALSTSALSTSTSALPPPALPPPASLTPQKGPMQQPIIDRVFVDRIAAIQSDVENLSLLCKSAAKHKDEIAELYRKCYALHQLCVENQLVPDSSCDISREAVMNAKELAQIGSINLFTKGKRQQAESQFQIICKKLDTIVKPKA